MKIAVFNGSPRKTGNTATLLKNCIEGAESVGASCELVHLYSIDYKGCSSCLQCKRLNGKHYGACAMKDGLTPILNTIDQYDALILGTPVYLGSETGEMRSFLERLVYPFLTYTPDYQSIFPKKIRTALIYTMNVDREKMDNLGYSHFMDRTQGYLDRFFGPCERLLSTDTSLFNDYSKYLSTVWDAKAKAKRKAEVFPQDCHKAKELGMRLAQSAKAGQQTTPST